MDGKGGPQEHPSGVGWMGRGPCLGEEGSQLCFHLPEDGRTSSKGPYKMVVSSWDGGWGLALLVGWGEVPQFPLLLTWPAAPGSAGGAGDEFMGQGQAEEALAVPWVLPAPPQCHEPFPGGTSRLQGGDPRVGTGCARPELCQAQPPPPWLPGRALPSQTTTVCVSPLPQSSMFRKLKYKSVNTGARDNDANEQREPEPPVHEWHPLSLLLAKI